MIFDILVIHIGKRHLKITNSNYKIKSWANKNIK